MKIKLPESILKCLNILNNNNFEAYLVGGAVRDILLNIPLHDYDICTNATPLQIKDIFKDYKILDYGIKHGTVTIFIDHLKMEITSYRLDGEYFDNRRPQKVTFTSSLKEDLRRRDFTVNAIAYNPEEGFIDCFNGQEDLKNKIIRCIDDPSLRFKEDALRILRAIRFCAQLNFQMEANTEKAVFRHKDLLINISMERKMEELFKILNTNSPILTRYAEILQTFIPDMTTDKIKGNKYTELALLLKNCSLETINCLKLDNKTKKRIIFIIRNLNNKLDSKYKIKKILAVNEEYLKDLLLIKNNKKTNQLYLKIMENKEIYSRKALAVTAYDLMELNIEKKYFSEYLNMGFDYVLKYPKCNHKELIINRLKKLLTK